VSVQDTNSNPEARLNSVLVASFVPCRRHDIGFEVDSRITTPLYQVSGSRRIILNRIKTYVSLPRGLSSIALKLHAIYGNHDAQLEAGAHSSLPDTVRSNLLLAQVKDLRRYRSVFCSGPYSFYTARRRGTGVACYNSTSSTGILTVYRTFHALPWITVVGKPTNCSRRQLRSRSKYANICTSSHCIVFRVIY
jgi:hypothetical protein